MGLTDQFSDEVSMTFPHSTERVWRIVSDLNRIGEWSPECYAMTWLDGAAGPAVGASFVGRNRMGLLRWSTTCTIVAWEDGCRLAYDARHVSGANTRWTFELGPHAAGTTVTQSYQTLGSPRAVMLLDRLARRPGRLRLGMSATLRAMGSAMELHDSEA